MLAQRWFNVEPMSAAHVCCLRYIMPFTITNCVVCLATGIINISVHLCGLILFHENHQRHVIKYWPKSGNRTLKVSSYYSIGVAQHTPETDVLVKYQVPLVYWRESCLLSYSVSIVCITTIKRVICIMHCFHDCSISKKTIILSWARQYSISFNSTDASFITRHRNNIQHADGNDNNLTCAFVRLESPRRVHNCPGLALLPVIA